MTKALLDEPTIEAITTELAKAVDNLLDAADQVQNRAIAAINELVARSSAPQEPDDDALAQPVRCEEQLLMTDSPTDAMIEAGADKIYATLHHLMRVTGTEAHDAYKRAAKSVLSLHSSATQGPVADENAFRIGKYVLALCGVTRARNEGVTELGRKVFAETTHLQGQVDVSD